MKYVQRGFSLLEGLISLFLFLLIVLFSLECFLNVKEHFTQLKEDETSNTSVYAALDRMRRDLFDAGMGLIEAITLQVLEGVSDEQGKLVVLSGEEDLSSSDPLYAGQQRILTSDAKKIKKGQMIGVLSPYGGEVHSVILTDHNSVVIDSPLASDYTAQNTRLILLRRICLFLDESKGVIRRKVNASPAQPLLEDVASFAFLYNEDANLVRLMLTLKNKEEKRYETTVFPKNTAMVSNIQKK
jgi:competence protein ComGF